jgi:hypothetical protein
LLASDRVVHAHLEGRSIADPANKQPVDAMTGVLLEIIGWRCLTSEADAVR